MHVDRPVGSAALRLAVTMPRPGQRVAAPAEHRIFRPDDAVLEPRERHQRLDGRAGRIGAAQDAVEERLVRVLGEREVLAARDAAGKAVRVERRQAREYQHVAVGRVDRHHAAAPAREGFLGHALQLDVDRHAQVAARLRLVRAQLRVRALGEARRPTLGVHQHLAIAAGAQQFRLVGAFDTGLADHAGPEIALTVHAHQVGLADRADVAERVGADRAVGIVARHARLEQHARQFVAVHGVARDFLVVELQQERDSLERAAGQHELAHAADVARLEQAESRQPRERVLEVTRLFADQLELVGGRVLGDHAPGAVEDDAAIRRQRLDAGAIALRQLDVVRVLHDLQPERAADQRDRDQGDDRRSEQHALEEHALLEGFVLDAHAPHGAFLTAAMRSARRSPSAAASRRR